MKVILISGHAQNGGEIKYEANHTHTKQYCGDIYKPFDGNQTHFTGGDNYE